MLDTMKSMIADISADAPWELVEVFAKFPRWKPEDVNASCDLMVERLARHGVPVEVHDADLYLSVPYGSQVIAGNQVFNAKSPASSVNMPGGIEGQLVYVPAAYSKSISTLFHRNFDADASASGRIGGKIVISEGFATPQKMREFEENGAIACIAVNPGVDAHWGACTSIWGTPDLDDLPRKPRMPIAAVNNPDGKALIAMAERGDRVRVVTRLDEGWFSQKLPVVTIPGAEEPEKFVLLHGHYDSWDVGVGDNATGDATLLEIARVLWKHRASLKRSVRIAWWPGHSTGRYAGSAWFADAFAIDLDENCVAQINCDSPGCRWATEFRHVSWMKETEAFAQSTIKAVSGLPSEGERPHRAGDYSFNNIGISSLMMLSSIMPESKRAEMGYYSVGGCGGNIAWHTENDTLEIADRDIMVRDIKVYLGLVVGIANADILPFDWRAIGDEFAATIARYQNAVGTAFDFAPARAANDGLLASLGRFHEGVAKGSVKPKAANDVIAGLARILVPINHTKTARFRHDPATPMAPLPTIASAMDFAALPADQRGFGVNQLRRGQNRLVAALREARRRVEAVLN